MDDLFSLRNQFELLKIELAYLLDIRDGNEEPPTPSRCLFFPASPASLPAPLWAMGPRFWTLLTWCICPLPQFSCCNAFFTYGTVASLAQNPRDHRLSLSGCAITY